jgi:hypothetical protein
MNRIRGRLERLERRKHKGEGPDVNWAGLPTLTGTVFTDGSGGLWSDLCGRTGPETDPIEERIAAVERLQCGLKEFHEGQPHHSGFAESVLSVDEHASEPSGNRILQ